MKIPFFLLFLAILMSGENTKAQEQSFNNVYFRKKNYKYIRDCKKKSTLFLYVVESCRHKSDPHKMAKFKVTVNCIASKLVA